MKIYNNISKSLFTLVKFGLLYTLIGSSLASASLITRAGFSGSETLETFSGDITAGSSVLLNGITYSSANSILFKSNRDTLFPNVPDISTGGALSDNAADSDVSVSFSTQVNRLGFYLTTGGNSTWLVDVFDDNGQLLGSNSFNTWGINPSVGAAFVGFEFSENINYFRVSQTVGSGYVFVMDDLRYEALNLVPEPSMLGLFMIAGLFLLKKRTIKTT